MSEAKHTPGPWKQCTANDGKCPCGLIWSLSRDFAVATALSTCNRFEGHNGGEGIPPDSEQFHANAKLIAAAPGLLAECETILAEMEEKTDSVSEDVALWMEIKMNHLRAAIEKAKA